MKCQALLSGGYAVLCLAAASVASAQTTNDPTVGGQLNQCWGQIASQTAQLDTSVVDANGGGMGIHTRAAAGQGDTFGDAFGFNTDGGRDGVGNVSDGRPHNVDPGDGGNGQHAINNSNDSDAPTGGFSNLIDPLTGDRLAPGTSTTDLHCDLVP
jgi:hypothetical protein